MSGIKLKCLWGKKNEYGINHNFQTVGERQLNNIFKLAEENMKMPIWRYNGKSYLETYVDTLSVDLMKIEMVTLSKLNLTKMNLTSWI